MTPLRQGKGEGIGHREAWLTAAQLGCAADFTTIERFDHDAQRAKPLAEVGIELAFEKKVRDYQAVIELERGFEQVAAIKVDDDRSVRDEERHPFKLPQPNAGQAPAR